MKLESIPAALLPKVNRLGPYARESVQRAAQFALKLHAEGVDVEHLLAALLEDEESAACQVILHAFADPGTILAEVIALCPGILVIGSKRSLPFSGMAVLAMDASRPIAIAEAAASITPRHLLLAAAQQLPAELAAQLGELGFDPALGLEPGALKLIPEDGPLLKFFDPDARRALSAACHCAVRLKRDAISPMHLMIGALEGQVGGLAGLTTSRLQIFFAGRDADTTPLPARSLPFSNTLIALLADQAEGGTSAALLAWIVSNASPELRSLLERQRVTSSLLKRTESAFRDPLPAQD